MTAAAELRMAADRLIAAHDALPDVVRDGAWCVRPDGQNTAWIISDARWAETIVASGAYTRVAEYTALLGNPLIARLLYHWLVDSAAWAVQLADRDDAEESVRHALSFAKLINAPASSLMAETPSAADRG